MAVKKLPETKSTKLSFAQSQKYFLERIETHLGFYGLNKFIDNPKIKTRPPYYRVEGKTAIKITVRILKATKSDDESGDESYRKKFLRELTNFLNFPPKKYTKNVDIPKEGLFEAVYNSAKSNESSIGLIRLPLNIKIICKYFEESDGLKPSNILPPIVDKWMTPEDIIKNVEQHLIRQTKLDAETKRQISLFMDKSLKETGGITLPGTVEGVKIPAEFVEVLTAIRLVGLLRKNDTNLKKILKIPKEAGLPTFNSSSPLLIFIPQASNYPLIDFQVSYIKNDYLTTFKVSTKSQIKSKNTNTVKFDQIFDSVQDVAIWYRETLSKMVGYTKRGQFGPATVAFSALRFFKSSAGARQKQSVPNAIGRKNFYGPLAPAVPAQRYANKAKVGFPIDAVGHLLTRGPDIINLESVIIKNSEVIIRNKRQKPTKQQIQEFGKICRNLVLNITSVTPTAKINMSVKNKKMAGISITENLISSNNQVNDAPAEPTVANLGKFCEKILEWASKENSATKHNYYPMFFQKVLQNKSIIYAIGVSTQTGNKNMSKFTTVNFQYRSQNNWQSDYTNWIGVRKKGEDSLGLDVH
jgi:hypothetical protein